MRTFLKNLERFRAATLLNLLGLTVAYVVGWLDGSLKVQGKPIEEAGFDSYVSGIDSSFVRLFDMQIVEGTSFDSNKSRARQSDEIHT